MTKTIQLFLELFAMSSSNSYFYSAIVAIVAVHAFLVVFIYVAVMEGQNAVTQKKE